MASYINKVVEKLGRIFNISHPASAAENKLYLSSYINPYTGENSVVKSGSIFEQAIELL